MEGVNWLVVGAASVATFLLGALWYSPLLFYKRWVRLNQFTEESTPKAGAGVFLLSFLAQLIATATLAFFIAGQGLAFAVAASASVGLAWIAMAFGVTYLFERRPLELWAINAGYHVVSFIIMGVILGLRAC